MTERDDRSHPEQPERSPEEMDGTNLLPEALKERMPALYSKEAEDDPMVECKFFGTFRQEPKVVDSLLCPT